MRTKLIGAVLAAASLLVTTPASAQPVDFEARFDSVLGTEVRLPQSFEARYETAFEKRIAELADGSRGRIGISAVDLSTGYHLDILGDQRFPMASTSKIAIAATFLEGVEKGRWSLTSEFPLLVPQRSAKFSSAVAPVSTGKHLPAIQLIELMITRSSNPATDALLRVVGGPAAVNNWAARNGIREFSLDRDIATLVRDDGEFDPATYIDRRDSATPTAMTDLLTALYRGTTLSDSSRSVILGAMSRTVTGKRRIKALIPSEASVSNKTGSLNNTSSDIGYIETPDGRTIALAIYVTGQGSRAQREAKIAQLARALYDGFNARDEAREWAKANYAGARSGGL